MTRTTTFATLQSLFRVSADLQQVPYFDTAELDVILQRAQLELVNRYAKDFEKNETARMILQHLTLRYTATSTSTINIGSITNFLYCVAVEAKFNFVCGSKQTLRTVPVDASTFDTSAVDELSPYYESDDTFPTYLRFNNGTNDVVEVYSTNVPVSVTVTYLKQPETINTVSTPTTVCDWPDAVVPELITTAIRIATDITQDQQRYQNQMAEMPLTLKT